MQPLNLVLTAAFIYQTTGNVIFTIPDLSTVTVGKPFNISWAEAVGGPVTLTLAEGPQSDLRNFESIGGMFFPLFCRASKKNY